jgi:2-polyprenyl-3-methyl-5-hydroxy-6-metoxy-1,4-benzoquinol methylase
MNTIVADYLDLRKDTFLDEMESEFASVMKLVSQYKTITPDTKVLEIGTGTGWFQIRCKRLGIPCRGLEIDPDLAACARELGAQHGVTVDIEVGSIEATDIGVGKYDFIVANSTFEHVEDWRTGLAKVAAALKDGGVFYFGSTNKFSFRSGEYWIPMYGWLPDSWRYRLRRTLQGDAIMGWGIDFNQFTYPQLRREFKRLGFSRAMDRADVLDPANLNNPTAMKKLLLGTLKRSRALKHLVLFFSRDTLFVCIK